MTIEDTELLKALKKDKPQPKKPADTEKVEAANELHDWLRGKDADRVQGSAALS